MPDDSKGTDNNCFKNCGTLKSISELCLLLLFLSQTFTHTERQVTPLVPISPLKKNLTFICYPEHKSRHESP